VTICPHGDPTCPCPDGDACHYEDADAMVCPNPPLGFKGVTWPHCHTEGCSWHVRTAERDVGGECGLLKLGLEPVAEADGEGFYSMTQARPGLPGWTCGWLRTPLNVSARQSPI
jgi:hypothetical protein